MSRFRYIYLGDRWTHAANRERLCNPVRRKDGRCIVSVARASALVEFEDGARYVVARRRLRLLEKWQSAHSGVGCPMG